MNELETFYPKNRKAWRTWLIKNQFTKTSIWVIYYKKKSNQPTITYNDAVDEALCFGWIDSKAKAIDDEKFMQFFCKRKPKSVWSKINKAKIEKLTELGLMMPSGFESVEIAKQNGSWTILDDVEALIIPEDLASLFSKNKTAENNFKAYSRTDQRNILQWIKLAKRPETRLKRIQETIENALLNQKPKPFQTASNKANSQK